MSLCSVPSQSHEQDVLLTLQTISAEITQEIKVNVFFVTLFNLPASIKKGCFFVFLMTVALAAVAVAPGNRDNS